jgi:hypothetical protein
VNLHRLENLTQRIRLRPFENAEHGLQCHNRKCVPCHPAICEGSPGFCHVSMWSLSASKYRTKGTELDGTLAEPACYCCYSRGSSFNIVTRLDDRVSILGKGREGFLSSAQHPDRPHSHPAPYPMGDGR